MSTKFKWIEARALSKSYDTSRASTNASLRDAFLYSWRQLTSQSRGTPSSEGKLWAVKDATFDVHAGEILGIQGENGAGKSTLLKLLARLTKPTSGSALVKGKVAAFLELGAGFHPDLSARENVLLNGAFLGMSRAETLRSMDAIAQFAEVEQKLDMPTKHLSSGMVFRLAFSVAIHLNADIFLMDEVFELADMAFREKCVERLKKLSREGKAILIVSHSNDWLDSVATGIMRLRSGSIVEGGSHAH